MISHVLEQASVGSVLSEAGHEVHIAIESKFDRNIVKKFKNNGLRLHFFAEDDDFLRFSSDNYMKYIGDYSFNGTSSYREHLVFISRLVNDECEYMMKDAEFLEGLQGENFDMVVVEPFILQMCTLILPRYLKLPFVSLTNFYSAYDIRAPALPSFYMRHFLSIDDRREATFYVRFAQLLVFLFYSTILSPFNTNLTLLHQYAPEVSSWDELLRQSLLFFYQVDHHFNFFLPAFPNHISVAGLTCSPAKPLPKSILDFINGRVNDGKDPGVILMSFGSTASYMPKQTVAKFLNAFGALNETVIAKLSIDENDHELKSQVPPNVLVLKWLPQNDLLGLPSTKLFITHCGNNGQHEALYHGVPMLGFPLFAEQDVNCRRMQVSNFGRTMNIFEFSDTELLEYILEILQNLKYKTSIRRMSNAFKNQPMTAREKILFWMEHVIKHGGNHIRSDAINLPLYQFLCFDTVALFVTLVAVVCYVLMKISVFALRRLLNFYTIICYEGVKKRQ